MNLLIQSNLRVEASCGELRLSSHRDVSRSKALPNLLLCHPFIRTCEQIYLFPTYQTADLEEENALAQQRHTMQTSSQRALGSAGLLIASEFGVEQH